MCPMATSCQKAEAVTVHPDSTDCVDCLLVLGHRAGSICYRLCFVLCCVVLCWGIGQAGFVIGCVALLCCVWASGSICAQLVTTTVVACRIVLVAVVAQARAASCNWVAASALVPCCSGSACALHACAFVVRGLDHAPGCGLLFISLPGPGCACGPSFPVLAGCSRPVMSPPLQPSKPSHPRALPPHPAPGLALTQ